MYRSTAVALALCLATITTQAASVIRSVGGDSTAASITPARDLFRTDLGGGTTAGAGGSFGGLRREINWDGVPAPASAPNNLAANFFNVNSPRGVVFSTPGSGFQVSGASADGGAGQPAAAAFGNVNPTYASAFGVFSAQRLFTAVSSNVTDVTFFQPGTTKAATVSGFGAVFTDVNTLGSTTLELFSELNAALGTFNVPTGTVASASLSFLGVSFNGGEKIGRVRITSGNAVLGAGVNDGGATDLVVMDDFIYSEPVALPDADGDGAPDSADNCNLLANPTQLDANRDGYGNDCDADLNNSFLVTTADFAILRSVLNQSAASSATAADADLNGSGTVTTADFAILRARLNTAPGPSGYACAGTIPCP